MTINRTSLTPLSVAALVVAGGLALAAGQYGPGASDTEIKIGNTMPYSGPASPYGTIGKSEAAYFAMINEQGGIHGRKINFISRDDSYSPPKTVELVRKLVEQDGVLALFQTFGTAPNSAIREYLNDNKVPQLFVRTGASKWNDPKHYPWTMGWQPSYQIEGRIYARYILKNIPAAKIAVLYQNDDFGKDYLIGLRDGLGDKADGMIVASLSYETTDATIHSQIVSLQTSGANVLLTVALPKFAAQTIRKIYEIGWKPTHPQQRVQFCRIGDAARRTREIRRHHLRDLWQRPNRSTVARHARIQRMAGLDEEIQYIRQCRRCRHRLRVLCGADDGRRAKGVRRQSHPREPN
jgi:branched-chain amino acid transport system substrate-binding protein